MLKKVFIVLATLFVFLLLWIGLNFKHIVAFPDIISSFYSKEFCSCYYVLKRDEAFCHNLARQYVPISEFKIDDKEKRIIVKGLGKTNSAKFINEKFGCVLEN